MPIIITTTGGGGGGGGGSTTTLGELIRRVRWLLEDYPLQGQMTVACSAGDQTITVDTSTPWDEGSRMEWDDDTGERAIVGDTLGSTLIELRRAAFQTTAVAHDVNTYLLNDPRFPYSMISQAVQDTVDSGFRGYLWAITSATATPSGTDSIYVLPADFVGLIRITQMTTANIPDSVGYGYNGSGYPVKILRDVDPLLASTGMALRIPSVNNTTNDLNITYGAEVTTDNISQGPQADAAVMGACFRLMGGKDGKRTGQDVSQGDASVTPGATIRTAAWFYQQFVNARREAITELSRRGTLAT